MKRSVFLHDTMKTILIFDHKLICLYRHARWNVSNATRILRSGEFHGESGQPTLRAVRKILNKAALGASFVNMKPGHREGTDADAPGGRVSMPLPGNGNVQVKATNFF